MTTDRTSFVTPDPSREIEQVIQEARQWLDEHNNQARRYSAKAGRIIRELLALLTAASPVSPDVRKWPASCTYCGADREVYGSCPKCGAYNITLKDDDEDDAAEATAPQEPG